LLSACGEFKGYLPRRQWPTPVILASQEAEIRRIMVQSQPGQIVHKTLSQRKNITKKCWWGGSRGRPRVQAPVLQKIITIIKGM
jgi:hypothetical protein